MKEKKEGQRKKRHKKKERERGMATDAVSSPWTKLGHLFKDCNNASSCNRYLRMCLKKGHIGWLKLRWEAHSHLILAYTTSFLTRIPRHH